MLSKEEILGMFEALNDELAKLGDIGEVGIVGGAVMCLVFDARKSTRDVDGIFKPTSVIRKLVKKIGAAFNQSEDWLNDAAKGFIIGDFGRIEVLNLSHLRVWAPEAKYMLAMKCLSARWDTLDRSDVLFLINKLNLKKKEDVFQLIEKYFPKNIIPAKTQFFLEEVFEK